MPFSLALATAISVASPSEPLNAFGREMAFDSAQGAYYVALLEHVPGVANKVPDWLSRVRRPPAAGSQGPRPVQLDGAESLSVPVRDASWWRTRAPPTR